MTVTRNTFDLLTTNNDIWHFYKTAKEKDNNNVDDGEHKHTLQNFQFKSNYSVICNKINRIEKCKKYGVCVLF